MNQIVMRSTKLLSLAILSLACANAWGQLPNQSRTSPLTYIGRFHGIGYSDGYHACPKGNCGKRSWWSPESFSSFYGQPTAPTQNSYTRSQPSYSGFQSSQYSFAPQAVPGSVPPATSNYAMPMPAPSPSDVPQRNAPKAEKPNWENIPAPLPDPQTLRQPPGSSLLLQSRGMSNPYR